MGKLSQTVDLGHPEVAMLVNKIPFHYTAEDNRGLIHVDLAYNHHEGEVYHENTVPFQELHIVNRNQNVMGKVVYLLVEKEGHLKPLVKLALESDEENVGVKRCEVVKDPCRQMGTLHMPLVYVVVNEKMIEED